MRILFVTNMWPTKRKPNYGIFVKKIFSHLEELDCKCSVVKPQHQEAHSGLIDYFLLYFKSFIYTIFSSVDIIYIHYSSHSSLGVLCAKPFTKKKIVVNVHGTDLLGKANQGGLFYYINRGIIGMSDLVIAPSRFFENILIKQYKCPTSKIFISPSGGVDRALFYPSQKTNEDSVITFGFVSNLIKGKGCKILLEVVNSVLQKGYDNFKIKIVGIGPEKEKLKIYINDNGMNKFVEFMPTLPHPELGNFFRTLDFFIFPTLLPESLGLVGLEAMACGVPTIGSNIGGIPYYLKDKQNGFLFAPGNHLELERLFISSLQMKNDQKRNMRFASIETASIYDSVNTIKGLANKLNEIINKNS